ncbi:putative transcription factor SRS family protein [Tanacetum coccineum]
MCFENQPHILKFSMAVFGLDLLCFGGCMMVVLDEDDGARWLCDGMDLFCVVSFRYMSKEDEDDGVRWRLWLEEENGYSGLLKTHVQIQNTTSIDPATKGLFKPALKDAEVRYLNLSHSALGEKEVRAFRELFKSHGNLKELYLINDVFKGNPSVSDKLPSSSSPLVDQKSKEISSSGNAYRGATYHKFSSKFSQFHNLHPIRAKKPLTIKLEELAKDDLEEKCGTLISKLKMELRADPVRTKNFRNRMTFTVNNALRKLKCETRQESSFGY